jgi:uncharacterized oxidoreductase
MRLSGKKILITGGGSGIGLELARRLADANHVIIAGRDEAQLERARADVPALHPIRLDVTSETEARDAVASLAADAGGLDLLVNNAGFFRSYPFASPDAGKKSVEDIEVNVVGVVRMTSLALPLLQASPEAGIVFISSPIALAAVPGYAIYGATKAAVRSLARSLRAELAGSGIRVFEAMPPLADTGPVRDVDVPKVSPGTVADAIVAGLEQDRHEIRIGRIRQLVPLARISPRLGDRFVRQAVTPPEGNS